MYGNSVKLKVQSKDHRTIHQKNFEEILLQDTALLCYLLVLIIPHHCILLAKIIFLTEFNVKKKQNSTLEKTYK